MFYSVALVVMLSSLSTATWEDYKAHFAKVYDAKEDAQRREQYEKNLKLISEHNALYDIGKVTYRLGLNKFSDVFHNELSSLVMNEFAIPNSDKGPRTFDAIPNLPPEVDWRREGNLVSNVKEQNLWNYGCKSCWTFAATGVLEGQYFRKTNTPVSFSEQQLLDCSGAGDCQNGGHTDQVTQGSFSQREQNKIK